MAPPADPETRRKGTDPPRRAGRPRSARSQRAILDAAQRILAAGSVDELTMEAVAAQAGVAKTTVYRRWPSKEFLALAVLVEMAEEQVPVPDLGDTRAELREVVRDTGATMTGTIAGRIIQGLVPRLATDPGLAREFRAGLVALRRREMAKVVARGVQRGDLRSDAQLDLAVELLVAPVFWRLLISGDPLDDAFAGELVEAALRGLGP